MLMDSGADVSLIPQAVLERLNLSPIPDQYYELLSFSGEVTVASVVQLEMSFLRWNFRGQFLLNDQEFGILGRNILNAIAFCLDGPNMTWDIIEKMKR